ncbi:hypothetical protein HanXRQr2_Chr12g0546051 [Helianthus annuus]|uniref:Uncharacterized protein n=1 Tax=Helianthus annuus TaxID=4232 RepID=A0A9K3HH87_HELAN|nr:hypothetical protein HanXRQr2_Chr12g0546051 [Helianthus annuus]KAJ0863069.1 hypothetical protein HanPSC8_Chr12g0525661 [Helianthus annuus]
MKTIDDLRYRYNRYINNSSKHGLSPKRFLCSNLSKNPNFIFLFRHLTPFSQQNVGDNRQHNKH